MGIDREVRLPDSRGIGGGFNQGRGRGDSNRIAVVGGGAIDHHQVIVILSAVTAKGVGVLRNEVGHAAG